MSHVDDEMTFFTTSFLPTFLKRSSRIWKAGAAYEIGATKRSRREEEIYLRNEHSGSFLSTIIKNSIKGKKVVHSAEMIDVKIDV